MSWETTVAFGSSVVSGIIRSLAVKYSPSDETVECKTAFIVLIMLRKNETRCASHLS